MPTPSFCPKCGARLAENAEACAQCPWSAHLSEETAGRKKFVPEIPAPLIFAVAIAAVGFLGWKGLTTAMDSANKDAQPRVEPKRDDRVVVDTSAIKLKPGSTWSVKGRVYDLMSLKPAAGARVVFRDRRGGAAVAATTDAEGRYGAALTKTPEGGYDVEVQSRGFAGFLEEMSPPYSSQPPARRREALGEARRANLLHVPLLPDVVDDSVNYDLVLLPR